MPGSPGELITLSENSGTKTRDSRPAQPFKPRILAASRNSSRASRTSKSTTPANARPSLRASHPEPVIDIHPETAGKLGIKEGDWVYIETKRGRITQKARLSTDIDPRVVFVDYDWWFPEASLSTLYDWDKSNINILTSNDLPRNREFGTPTIRGILCKVYPVE